MNDFKIIYDKFNNLTGENQIELISEMIERGTNISKFLNYLSGELKIKNKQESFISIITKDDDIDIVIKSNITEKLYENDHFNSMMLIKLINSIVNLYIEIEYPSKNFNKIYETIIELKKTKCYDLKVMILISEIEETDTFFKNNIDIEAIKIDSNVKTITGGFQKGSFENCTNLKYVSIGNSVTTIGGGAFYGCINLEEINIPDSVVNIEEGAFSNCSALESIRIPSFITEIKDSTFKNCSSLSKITICDSVKRIGNNALENCAVLTSIQFPTSLMYICNCAFKNCMSLMDAKIPNSVRHIGDYAFYNCHYLKNFYIPHEVTFVGKQVNDCDYYYYRWNYPETFYLSDYEVNISDNEEDNEEEEANEYY